MTRPLGLQSASEWLTSRVDSDLVEGQWALGLVAFGILTQSFSIWEQYHRLGKTERLWLFDHVIFEYIGWFTTRAGGRLYVDIWAIKPPLSFELPALLALVFGGDIYVYHLANIALTNLVLIATPVILAGLVIELTDDVEAGVLAGVALYIMPRYHWRAPLGFKAKYYVLFAGFAALYLYYRDNPLASGVAGAAAVGFWQLGAIFPLLTGALTIQRKDWWFQRRWGAGIVLGGLAILAPVVLVWRTAPAMVAEVAFAPLLFTESTTAAERLQKAIRLLDVAFPIFLFGVLGCVWALVDSRRDERWWLSAGLAFFAVQVVFLDLDRHPDLFLIFAFAVVGLGVLAGSHDDKMHVLTVLIVLLAVLNVVTVGGFGAGKRTPLKGYKTYQLGNVSEPVDTTGRLGGEERQHVFWQTVPVESCRVFAGRTQWDIAKRTGIPLDARRCGTFSRYWHAFNFTASRSSSNGAAGVVRPLP